MTWLIQVDYNEIHDDEHTVVGRVKPRAPQVGETAETYDADGNCCAGKITKIDGNFIHVKLNWKTWVPNE